MAVGGIKGESKGSENVGPQRKKKTKSDIFREMMKVDKTKEVDPEEKRKRKQRHEAEEEAKAKITKKEPNVAGPAGREDLFGIGAPEGAEPPPPSAPPPHVPSHEPGKFPTFEKQAPAKKPAAPEKKGQKKKALPRAKKKEAHEMITPGKSKKIEEKPFKKPEKIEEKKKPKEPVQIEKAAPELTKGAWETTKALSEKELYIKEKKKKPISHEAIMPTAPQSPVATPAASPAEVTPLQAPFANLPPQVRELFERMIGVMTVMSQSEIRKTTIFLDAPKYKNSAFYKCQIVITEHTRSAPLAYNIEFKGNANAVNLLQGPAEELVAAFQGKGYNFKVHRIELSIDSGLREKKAKRVKRKKGG